MPPPDADRWDRLEALFEAAAARPEADWEEFLAEASADDPALAAEVLELLRHRAAAEADWGESAEAFAGPLLDAADFQPGDRIGPYALDRPLGRGGMGTVWLAHRADDLRLPVALKVVRLGLDTADVRVRFRQEQRVLGALDHPGIARLLDGGVTPDGRPYVAMEVVDGEPIDAFCDRRRLPVAERLRLFGQVCEAVQYAHQRLVVHRDLKPSNILVAEDAEGRPRAKLLDFGIAKVLDPGDLGLSRLLTGAGQRLLTPAFASPEQLRGEPVTTASDVYQLGGLLYQLLTGRVPVTARRLVEPAEPVRPSDAVRHPTTVVQRDGTTATLSPEAVSEARRLAPARLRKALAGDLDTIVLMALRPEPGRRYVSAAQLGEDVARHLAGQTVRARPDTVGYRARTFANRHRRGVAVSALAVLLLVAFAGTMAVERARTAREAAKAHAVADVLAGLFAATNPTVANGDTLTVVEFLEASEGRLRTDLAGQPEVLGEVLTVVGSAFRDMRAFGRAAPALHDALALRRRVLGPDAPDVAATLGALAQMQFMADSLDAALETARAQRRLLSQRYGPTDRRVLPAVTREAAVHLQAGRLGPARVALDEGLAITRPLRAEDPDLHLQVVGLEGWYAAETGDHEASVRVAREILALHARTGAPQADIALAERILGNELLQVGRFEEARISLDRSLARYRRVFGPDNGYVALVLGHLADVAAAEGDATTADRLYAESLPMRVRFFGPGAPEVGGALLRYGRHARLNGRPALADSLLGRAEQLWTAARGSDDPNRQVASAERALLRFDRGDRAAAVDTLDALWARIGPSPPSRHRATLALRVAALRRRQGRAAEAEALRREAAPLLRASPLRREVAG